MIITFMAYKDRKFGFKFICLISNKNRPGNNVKYF